MIFFFENTLYLDENCWFYTGAPTSIAWSMILQILIANFLVKNRKQTSCIHSLIWAVTCLHSGARCAENADEVIFRHFQGEGVVFFFNRTSLTPLLRFLMRIF